MSELAFTGNTFFSKEDILLYSVTCGYGTIFDWCRELTKRLGCVLITGYLEYYQEEYFNSMIVMSQDGTILRNYRKCKLNLSYDKFFSPGLGYDCLDVNFSRLNRIIRVGLAIGSDILNFYPSDFEKMDFAEFNIYYKV